MSHGDDDRQLVHWLRGEMASDERSRLDAELARDAGLAQRLAQLRRSWEELDVPEPDGVGPGFTTRVMARATAAATHPLWPAPAPAWVRRAAVTALVVGVALGGGVGWASGARGEASGDELAATGPTLAESYFDALAGTADGEVWP